MVPEITGWRCWLHRCSSGWLCMDEALVDPQGTLLSESLRSFLRSSFPNPLYAVHVPYTEVPLTNQDWPRPDDQEGSLVWHSRTGKGCAMVHKATIFLIRIAASSSHCESCTQLCDLWLTLALHSSTLSSPCRSPHLRLVGQQPLRRNSHRLCPVRRFLRLLDAQHCSVQVYALYVLLPFSVFHAAHYCSLNMDFFFNSQQSPSRG